MEMGFSTLLDNRVKYSTVLYRLSMVVANGVESGAGRGGIESRLLLAYCTGHAQLTGQLTRCSLVPSLADFW